MHLEGTTILVTGGAVRIGEAITRALAAAGAGVVIHARASRTKADALCRQIREADGPAWVVEANLARPTEATTLVSSAAAAAGKPLDGLINNAARFTKETLDAFSPDSLEEEFRVNLFAPLMLMQAFAAQGNTGSIVNLLDRRIAGLDTECAPYVLTKKGLADATRLAALTWAPRIRVNAVAPGPILPPPGKGEDYLHDRAGTIPLECRCTPEAIAEAVLFLMRADTVTGQTLYIDGGQHLL